MYQFCQWFCQWVVWWCTSRQFLENNQKISFFSLVHPPCLSAICSSSNSYSIYIYMPWPFPPVWGVADNTHKTKTMGVLLLSSSNDEGPSRVWMALLIVYDSKWMLLIKKEGLTVSFYYLDNLSLSFFFFFCPRHSPPTHVVKSAQVHPLFKGYIYLAIFALQNKFLFTFLGLHT